MRREFEPNVNRADLAKTAADHALGQLRPVALAAEVRQVEMAQARGHDLVGNLRRCLVGKMAVAAEDTLLEAPGPMWAILQHFDVVVGFQHQDVRGAHPLDD